MRRPAVLVDQAAILSRVHFDDIRSKPAKQDRRCPARRAVGCINNNAKATKTQAWVLALQEPKVVFPRIVHPACSTHLIAAYLAGRIHLQQRKIAFNGFFVGIREFSAPRAKELDAVVLGRIVRSRDHCSGSVVGIIRQQQGQPGGWKNAEILDCNPCLHEPCTQRGCQHLRRNAGIPGNSNRSF